MLRRVGFFAEFYPDHPSLPMLSDHVCAKAARFETRIVGYLRTGHMVAAVMEGMTDYFDGTPFDEGSGCSSLLTDGEWLWRQDLAHYVERYHVELPREFVRRVVDAGFQVPYLSSEKLRELTAAEKDGLGADWWALP